MKKISIVTPCHNEEANIGILYKKVKEEFTKLNDYTYEHIFIDNCSKDNTRKELRALALKDKNIKLIFNSGNFGHIRSPYYALFQSTGDAVMLIVADLQDPPELIPKFIESWENGHEIVIGIKKKSLENPLMFLIRKIYYSLLKRVSENELINNFTGFGLYDKKVIEALTQYNEPYPYFRGLISQIGFNKDKIEYIQPKRLHGKTKNNFYTLFDMAMNGFVNNSKIPLRMATFIGFGMGFISFGISMYYLVYKLINWQTFQIGIAPLVSGLFFFASIQLLFIGIIGEYIGAIYTQVKNQPLVIERERINFEGFSKKNSKNSEN